MKFILGKKIGMSQIFDENDNVIPVTIIEAGPCFITQVKNKEKDGYQAVQLGFIKSKKERKSKKGKQYKYIKEFRIDNGDYKAGDEIRVDSFEKGEKIKASAVSKGKGFQGVVKRHGFSGGPASHGHRHVLRTPGSIGGAYPQRVIKGKKMPGRTGGERFSIKNLEIALVDKENNLIAVKGAIPGPNSGLVELISE
ncbi:MAG: 50S ribosomal protein L3 [Candidatus Portnoybacteria bacterium]|nr:50S ribosomal protein L3 [Candidatus Portnoybacteria bacterium]